MSQMAAQIRIAKENEYRMRDEQRTNESSIEEFRQECNAWRVESDRLWCQVKDLQTQLREIPKTPSVCQRRHCSATIKNTPPADVEVFAEEVIDAAAKVMELCD